MAELWTPLREGPHEDFVERLHRTIAGFAESVDVKAPLVELELSDGARFVVDRIQPQPGFGMITIYVHGDRDPEAPDALIVPIGTIRRIELRAGPEQATSAFGFST
jgi:hypothetical protein